MKPEDKQLLLADLCARLPYNVWVSYKTKYDDIERATILNGNYVRDIMEGTSSWIDFKPYLRPMSSMTEEEREELKELTAADVLTNNGFGYENLRGMCFGMMYIDCQELIDWLNANHFDYRGLIDKGLAIEVTEENNPYKN